MHTRIVLVYTCINPVTKRLFLSFIAIANLLYCQSLSRWERLSPSRIMLYSSMHRNHPTLYHPGGAVWSRVSLMVICSGQFCSRCPLVIGLFSQKHIPDWLILLFKYNALLVFIKVQIIFLIYAAALILVTTFHSFSLPYS